MENSNVPNNKSCLVKQVVKVLVITIEVNAEAGRDVYKQKLTQVSIWDDDEVDQLDAGGSY
jgi:hypothetical protein